MTINSGSSTKTCYKDCQEGCPDGYYEPSTNSDEWNVVKDLMNLDERNGCYKPTSCKSSYHDASEMKDDFQNYFTGTTSISFGGLKCIAGSCKTAPNTSYFTTSDYDIGDGTKCKYATGCNYEYSSYPDTSGCINTSPVATSGNIECYEKGPDGTFTVTLVIDHYYESFTTHDYTLYSASVSCPYTTRVAVDISTGTGSYSASDNGGIQCGGSSGILTQVDGIQNGRITSVQPQESSSSLSDCGSFSYNFGPNIGERTYVVKFEYVINDHR